MDVYCSHEWKQSRRWWPRVNMTYYVNRIRVLNTKPTKHHLRFMFLNDSWSVSLVQWRGILCWCFWLYLYFRTLPECCLLLFLCNDLDYKISFHSKYCVLAPSIDVIFLNSFLVNHMNIIWDILYWELWLRFENYATRSTRCWLHIAPKYFYHNVMYGFSN